VTIQPWGIRNLTDFPRHPQYCSCPPGQSWHNQPLGTSSTCRGYC